MTMSEITAVALVGVATTSSSLLGAAIGLYLPLSKRLLACTLAFAAGALISALAIDLGFLGALDLRHGGYSGHGAWAVVSGGFAAGACLYLAFTRVLEARGSAVRFPARFRDRALQEKRRANRALIATLARSDMMRHLPPADIETILEALQTVDVPQGREIFHAGDTADALFIVADGSIEILSETGVNLATLQPGEVFGEMALLAGEDRNATARAAVHSTVLKLERGDFDLMLAGDRQLAAAAQSLSHGRALRNLTRGTTNPARWARVARGNLQSLSRGEVAVLLKQAGDSAGVAIILGNILDTIPGCLVIGAKYHGAASLAVTLILGMFVGGIPEAAASASILRRAGYPAAKVFLLWSTVLIAGLFAAVAGHVFISDPHSLVAVLCQAVAGGAVLALVAHAMIPEAIHEAGSLIVMPTVAGFLFALYAAVAEAA